MQADTLDYLEICTAETCQYAVIWLHGLGASGHDFEPIVPELKIPFDTGVRFLFPHAPVRPITINGGAPMRGWYDITSLDFGSRQQDLDGIQQSAAHIETLVTRELQRGIQAHNILLAGFSQGGAIALYYGLTATHQFGGILALSTYLPAQQQITGPFAQARQEMPIFMAHGLYDDVIAIQHAEQSRDIMKAKQLTVDWKAYPMAHSVSPEEINDISDWLLRQIR